MCLFKGVTFIQILRGKIIFIGLDILKLISYMAFSYIYNHSQKKKGLEDFYLMP